MNLELHYLSKVPCIYSIDLQDGGPAYVGQTVNLAVRIRDTLEQLRNGTHGCKDLQDRFSENAVFTLLEIQDSRRLRNQREVVWSERLSAISTNYGWAAGRLTDDQVRAIRSIKTVRGEGTLENLAKEMGVKPAALYRIRSGLTYKHVK